MLRPGGRTDLHATIDTAGRTDDRRGDFDSVYGDWAEVAGKVTPGRAAAGVPAAPAGGADGDLRPGCGWPPTTRRRC